MAIEAGQQLLHFRLIEKIGEGGMVEERAVVAFEVDDPSGQLGSRSTAGHAPKLAWSFEQGGAQPRIERPQSRAYRRGNAQP